MQTIVCFVDIILISVSRQKISLLFKAACKYFYLPTHQKIHIYIYICIYIYILIMIKLLLNFRLQVLHHILDRTLICLRATNILHDLSYLLRWPGRGNPLTQGVISHFTVKKMLVSVRLS